MDKTFTIEQVKEASELFFKFFIDRSISTVAPCNRFDPFNTYMEETNAFLGFLSNVYYPGIKLSLVKLKKKMPETNMYDIESECIVDTKEVLKIKDDPSVEINSYGTRIGSLNNMREDTDEVVINDNRALYDSLNPILEL